MNINYNYRITELQSAVGVAQLEKASSFVSSKKLRLNPPKCANIHTGNRSSECPQKYIHDDKMKSANEAKYLGDIFVSLVFSST